MAESRLYKIAHPAIFCDLSFGCLVQTGPATDHGITESDRSVISLTPPLFLLPAKNRWAAWGTIQLLGELYLPAFGAAMLTSKEYLQRAEECSQLANASSDVYVKEALTELASDFKAMAKDLEQRNERWRTDHGLDGKCDSMKIIAGLTWNGWMVMLSAHITSFLKLIDTQLEETSRGVTSSHHFHNVQCGIENILSLLEYNNDVVDKADQLSRRASNYITRHGLISSKISDRDISEDADRLRATYEALAGFRFAVEHSQPNSRVRTLGLVWNRLAQAFQSRKAGDYPYRVSILCGRCSSVLGWTALGVNTRQQQHRDKDECDRHKGKIGGFDRYISNDIALRHDQSPTIIAWSIL
jgi:hypothetical protein